MWRREWDSNPRLFRVTGFQDRLLKPLGHLSVYPSFNSNAGFILTQLFPLVNRFLQKPNQNPGTPLGMPGSIFTPKGEFGRYPEPFQRQP